MKGKKPLRLVFSGFSGQGRRRRSGGDAVSQRDTLGLIWSVVVHEADWQDQQGACCTLDNLRTVKRVRRIYADSAYGRSDLPAWVEQTYGWILETVRRPFAAQGFVLLPKRWIVKRTFAWLARCRRHSKDYEHNPETSEALIQISMISLMSKRLANSSRI